MTLIIGLKCSDGIVLGADGIVTSSSIRQAVSKLDIIAGCCVVGVSGPVGLRQRLVACIDELWAAGTFSKLTTANAMLAMRTKFLEHLGPEMQAVALARGALGDGVATNVLSQTLVALPFGGSTLLCTFDPLGSPQEVTNALPIATIGSGTQMADPFMAFQRRLFWPNQLPSIADGTFAVYWALDHTIRNHPGGVGGDKQIVVLRREKQGWRASDLSDSELEEHGLMLEHAENYIAEFPSVWRNRGAGTDAPSPPPVPGVH